MVRSRLRNECLKLKTIESRLAYTTQQRNYCGSLIRQAKRNFYENLDPNLITDNRKFWKQVKPFFSDKTPKNTNIMLLEVDKIITEPACAEIFNNYFSDAVSKLDIDQSLHVISVTNSDHPVDRAIEIYKNHPSILKINQLRYPCDNFFFRENQRVVLLNLLRTLIPLKHTQKIIYLLKY